jgi:hypothetical protein
MVISFNNFLDDDQNNLKEFEFDYENEKGKFITSNRIF